MCFLHLSQIFPYYLFCSRAALLVAPFYCSAYGFHGFHSPTGAGVWFLSFSLDTAYGLCVVYVTQICSMNVGIFEMMLDALTTSLV